MTTHYIGEHVGVPKQRLEQLAGTFGRWIYEVLNNTDPAFCECQIISKCVAEGKTPEEIAVLAYISGKTMAESGGAENVVTSIQNSKGSSIKN